MDYKFFIGIDVSKNTLDVCLIEKESPDVNKHIQIKNSRVGMLELLKWLKQVNNYSIAESIFCMEHTGIYNYHALEYLVIKDASIWVENAVHIKRSIGLQRGKSDRVDAKRIAEYALRNARQARLWEPAREEVDEIRQLSNLRDQLVETKSRLENSIREYKQFGKVKLAKLMEKNTAKSLKAIDDDIERIEKQIKEIINDDDQLKKLFQLITSVVGVGFVTATNLIIHTNEFTMFNNVRQLACYCGVVPFEHTSGKSVRGKSRVSHLANKKLKTNLHMGTLSAVKLDPVLKTYYERKVAEGKNKMSVLNAVRNKLLHRIFAVVKRGTPYIKINSQIDLVLS